MKSTITTNAPSFSSYQASIPSGHIPQPKDHYNGRQAFCPGAGWTAWGYVAMLRNLKTADMAQA